MGVISSQSLLELALVLHLKIAFVFSGSHQSPLWISTHKLSSAFLTDKHLFYSTNSCYDLKGHDLAFHPVSAILNLQLTAVFTVWLFSPTPTVKLADELSSANFTSPNILLVSSSLWEVLNTLSVSSPIIIQIHLLFSVSPLFPFPCQLFSLGWNPRSNPTCL